MNGSLKTGFPDRVRLVRTWFWLFQNKEQAKRPVYDRLPDKADILLKTGMTVIVDVAFLKKNDRMGFAGLAECRSVPFALVSVSAPMEILVGQVCLRPQRNDNVSLVEFVNRGDTTDSMNMYRAEWS